MMPAAYVTAARRRLAGMGRRSRYLAMSQSMQAARNLVLREALPDGDWRYERALSSVSDVTAYIVRAGHGETGVLKIATTVRTDGIDEVEQEPSMMHPATKATGNPTRRRQGFGAFLEAGGEPAHGKPIM